MQYSGYLDDLLLVPLGIVLALKLIPAPEIADCRARARDAEALGRLDGRGAAAAIVALWLFGAAVAVGLLARRLLDE